MADQGDLLSGMMYYQQHEYISALKHFTKCATLQTNQISQMIASSLEAITNMQLCNYNQAAEQLGDLRLQLSNWEKQPSESNRAAEVELLKVKVLANLLIIYLVNCNEETQIVLSEIIAILEERYSRNKTAGVALFKALLKSLFGYQSFYQMQNELVRTLDKIERQANFKFKVNKDSKQLMFSPIFLSSFSIYSHLTGNMSDALLLEKTSYSLSKSNNPIAAVLSLRHLQELQRQLSNQKQRKYYHQELISLMSNEELEGIAEQTLFRNYSLKLEAAHKVVLALAEKEKEFIEQEQQDISRQAVLWKLKMMRNRHNSQKIEKVIQMLTENASVLRVMAEAQFIRESLLQYTQIVNQIGEIAKRCRVRIIMSEVFERINQYVPAGARAEKESRIININIIEEQKQSRIRNHFQQLKPITPSKGKKHSTLFLPPKNISAFRSELPKEQDNNSSFNESQISIKTPIHHKNYQKNQVYLHEPEKQKVIYKIGKNEPKKSQKIEKGRQISKDKSKVERSERSRSRDEVEPKEKSQIAQFMKPQSIIPKEKVEKEYISLPVRDNKVEQMQQEMVSQTHQIKESSLKINKEAQQNQASNLNNQIMTNPQASSSSEIPPNRSTFVPLGSRGIEHKSSNNSQEKLESKLRKCINSCILGQYVEKRHFSSDGGAQRFLKLSQLKDKIFWGQDEDHYDQSSYPINDIKGIVFGKITETLIKQSNKKLQPWKCFSLIMKKRTFDVYCPEEKDLKFWIPGLSLFLKDLKLDNQKYAMKKLGSSKIEKQTHNNVVYGDKVVTRFYSIGRVLWKRFLMRIQSEYLKSKKKEKRNVYRCANAYAIVVCAVRQCNYKPSKLKIAAQ